MQDMPYDKAKDALLRHEKACFAAQMGTNCNTLNTNLLRHRSNNVLKRSTNRLLAHPKLRNGKRRMHLKAMPTHDAHEPY